MNEKFKLLALEAKMGTADFDAGSYYVATPDRMQKLCELIVRECVGVVLGSQYLLPPLPRRQLARHCGLLHRRLPRQRHRPGLSPRQHRLPACPQFRKPEPIKG